MGFLQKSIIFTYFLLSLNSPSFAQIVGPLVPSIYSSSGSGASWGNLSGVQTIDNNPAYVDLAQYPTCNNFMCYRSNVASFSGFGFSIPANALITGVELNVMQRVSSPGGGIHDSVLTLAINNVAIGNNYANPSNWLDSPQTQAYGGATDTWGNTLTPAQVNDSNFGILYELTNTSYDQPASVDYMTMTIHFQIGTSLYTQNSNFSNINFDGQNIHINVVRGEKLNIYNANGQLVYNKSFGLNNPQIEEHIEVTNWKNGIYFVQVEGQQGLIFKQKIALIK